MFVQERVQGAGLAAQDAGDCVGGGFRVAHGKLLDLHHVLGEPRGHVRVADEVFPQFVRGQVHVADRAAEQASQGFSEPAVAYCLAPGS